MQNYEHVMIARPDVSPQQIDGLIEDLTRLVEAEGGKVEKNEYWGLRNLAYPIRKSRKGHYALLNISGPSKCIQEMERKLRINEDVLRFMTVRVEDVEDGPSAVLAKRDTKRRR